MLKLVPLLLALVFVAAPGAALADPQAPNGRAMSAGGPRVRANDGRSAALLLEGLRRSDTIRTIVNEIETRDVIVYVEMRPGLKRKLAGSVTWIAATNSFRYIRIALNPEMGSAVQIATLGHELQHALEVARESSIVSETTLTRYYAKNGLSMPAHENGWDTLAARDTGEQVRRELAADRTAGAAETVQAFNPQDWHSVYRRAQGMLPP